jgi:hypothetical protein
MLKTGLWGVRSVKLLKKFFQDLIPRLRDLHIKGRGLYARPISGDLDILSGSSLASCFSSASALHRMFTISGRIFANKGKNKLQVLGGIGVSHATVGRFITVQGMTQRNNGPLPVAKELEVPFRQRNRAKVRVFKAIQGPKRKELISVGCWVTVSLWSLTLKEFFHCAL